MNAPEPRICCVDLDTFFVSVERIVDPSLVGKPVVVGGRKGGGGVVTAASYEVREFGVHSGMSIRDATRLAPHAIFLSGHHGLYSDYAARAREILERYSPVVRAASIDEAYMDFRGCERLYHAPEDRDGDQTIARTVNEMRVAIQQELGLPASAGIATSRSMAKVACGLAKPAGVLLVPAGEEARTLAPLPVRKLPGVGKVAEAKLLSAGVTTLGELADAAPEQLREIFGVYASGIQSSARGVGGADLGRERPAFREHDPVGLRLGSISNERTFREASRRSSEAILASLCERVCWRARKRGVKARTVTLKLRYTDFETLTRARTFGTPTYDDAKVYRALRVLYGKARVRELPIRLIGVALSNLQFPRGQLELIDPDDEHRCSAVDTIRERFGYDAVRVATAVRPRPGDRSPR